MSTPPTNTPIVREEWWCCSRSYTNYRELVDHIDSSHLLGAAGYEEKLCNQCYEVQLTLSEAIIHYITYHLRYQFRCMKCLSPFEYFGDVLEHLANCETETTEPDSSNEGERPL